MLALAAVLLLIGAGITYLWLRSSLPVTEGSVSVPGLDGPAEISRDPDGLVHIRAQTTNDAYYALGYAHAQDRMWQMDSMRRLGAGRLAEVVGPRVLVQDRLMRTIGLYARSEASLAQLSPETRDALAAYARGVNAWIASRRGALPPEFVLLGFEPEPWRPADSLVWGRLMAWNLSGNWRRQMARARIEAHLGAEAARRLFLPYPEDAPVTVPLTDLAGIAPAVPQGTALDPDALRLLDAMDAALPPAPPRHSASNAWAIAGTHTASGRPLLANDPHLGLRAPNVWYLARIATPDFAVAGATAPGVPFHVLGHNGRIAWGMTTTGADTDDLVVERLDPADPGRYLAPDGPRAFRTREETIRVRGGEDVVLTVRETRNGPVVSDIAGALSGEVPPGTVIVLRSAMLADGDRSGDALRRINLARSWSDFTAALEFFESPVQNLFYADTDGNIGVSVAGRIPIRGQGAGSGEEPARGDDPAHDWQGFIPAGALPRSYNPGRGTIVNANNRAVGPAYPHLISRDWDEPYRARRIEDQLAVRPRHDVTTSRALLMDVVSYAARDLLPLLMRETPRSAETEELLERLAAWDGRVARDRMEPLLFNAWMERIMVRLFADELGPYAGDFSRVRPRLIQRVIESDTAWCNDVTTEARESCGEMLAAALDDARADLEAQLGDVANWRWGALHQANLRNLFLDWIPVVGRLTRVTVETDGDDFTVNRGTYRTGRRARYGDGPFAHVHGATFRGIYDLADLERSLYAMPGGQSGNPLSPRYADLTEGWRDGGFVTLPARPRWPVETLHLVPHPPSPPTAQP